MRNYKKNVVYTFYDNCIHDIFFHNMEKWGITWDDIYANEELYNSLLCEASLQAFTQTRVPGKHVFGPNDKTPQEHQEYCEKEFWSRILHFKEKGIDFPLEQQ